MKRYRAERRARDERMKNQDAMLILMAIIYIGSAIGMFSLTLHMLLGIKGILYGLSVVGLLWVAYVQIRKRL
ncbi:hypothetical protein [Chelativorans xinjiangense]|uniref:hypothetical protein n=1 Tax=Chelativorans xinjiangense TaxID=2681485 RepID=UPI001357E17D|nr:hypothetical protein [Chelativorans xinjiangense]